MFSIAVGVCFSSHKKSVTANSVCIFLFGDFELQVSACYGHRQAALKTRTSKLYFQKGKACLFTMELKYTALYVQNVG
jgi:hypothetical protein